MLRLNQLKLTPDKCREEMVCISLLKKKAARLLHVRPEQITELYIIRKALDARKKPHLFYSFSVGIRLEKHLEQQILKRTQKGDISAYEEKPYVFPEGGRQKIPHPPVIIGTGPAGLFCGLYLAKCGYRPILLERGKPVEQRIKDVNTFWQTGILNTESNVQFGEGGAGTFSDGKLNTLVKDPEGRHREVLRCFVENGAPPEILYESRPHLGTDMLADIVKNIREKILALGGEIRFSSCVTDLVIKDGKICALEINQEELLPADIAVLAIGHSARDTLAMLQDRRVFMESKSFAVGVRIEHPQTWIDESQYGADCPYEMPPAFYKVTAKSAGNRGVYSFCMCPGGYVVNASSEQGMLAVNGMSYSTRDGKNANSAMIVTVTPEDYGSFLLQLGEKNKMPGPLAGVYFQRALEKRAFAVGGGKIPVQRFGDFRANRISAGFGSVIPQTKGENTFSNVRGIFPPVIGNALEEGILSCGKKIRRFADDDVLLSGVESRTSSPVRILRDDSMQSCIRGLYPCGEGAGYAGGITSAAMDGLRVAEAVRKDVAI